MIEVLVQAKVRDLDVFMEGFRTRGHPLRQRHGSRRARVLRHADQADAVSILFEWESREHFEAFLADPEVRESMKAGGTLGPPSVTYLTLVDLLDA